MRPSRTVAASLLVAALAATAPARADDHHHGSFLVIRPTVRRTAVDFVSWASSTGGVLGSYVAHFTVTGTIAGDGYVVGVDDSWTQAVATPGTTKPVHHDYPAERDSDVLLVYTGQVVVAATGLPVASCHSVLTRTAGGAPVVTGTC